MTPESEPPDQGLIKRVRATTIWDQNRPTLLARVGRWSIGRRDEPAVGFAGVIEDPAPERIGICCSGGGIRSASFNLGVLQALQSGELLYRAEYLAAVSGGSYIAAAVSMVAKTWDPGPPDPPGDDSDARLVTERHPPFYEGSPEEQYLRNRASYMAPSGMGKILLGWRILCGMLINVLFIASALVLLAAVASLYYRVSRQGLVLGPHGKLVARPGTWLEAGTGSLAGIGLLMGLASVLTSHDGRRRFLETWSLRLIFGALVLFSIAVVLPAVVETLQQTRDAGHQKSDAIAPALSGPKATYFGGGIGAALVTIFTAVALQLRAHITDPKEAIAAVGQAAGRLKRLGPHTRLIIVRFAATIAGPLLLAAILVAATMLQMDPPEPWLRWVVPVGALTVFAFLFVVGDLTAWSLHPFYRRRLCTAFALKRVSRFKGDHIGGVFERRQGELALLSRTGVVPREPWWKSTKWPTLVVCAAANISDAGVTPPGRGVTSFTFSPGAMGGPLVGGISTASFEDMVGKRRREFTLPAAVAVSGAALSPSMGKLSLPSLRFLLALANIRLGVWIPNPRRIDAFKTTRRTLCKNAVGPGNTMRVLVTPKSKLSETELNRAREDAKEKTVTRPRPHPWYLVKELLGRNSINDKYLYVSDGGHYENLGLVELLRRGCTRIYCFDASGGTELSSLGDALALARSELGVEIDFARGELESVRELDGKPAERACAVGTIHYGRNAESAPGTLVYAPTVMTVDLPWDVHAFKESDERFPHHSTVEQLFTDQKFEAYRVLGRHAGREALRAMEGQVEPPRMGADG